MHCIIKYVFAIGTRVLEFLIFLSPLVVCIVWFFVGIRIEERRLQSYFSKSSYSELITSCKDDVCSECCVMAGDDKLRIVYMKAANPLIHPSSGCPVMVFDENGMLLDKTPDEGRDVSFKKKWHLDNDPSKIGKPLSDPENCDCNQYME